MTVEAVEIIPVGDQGGTPAASEKKTEVPAPGKPAATPAPAKSAADANK
jgi:hypothetical protein